MFKTSIVVCVLSIIVCCIGGCKTNDAEVVSHDDFAKRKTAEAHKAVILVAGDQIEVSVEVDGQMEVAAHRASITYAGFVTLPLVGDVKISGQTLSNARKAITEAYGSFFVNSPVVMISTIDDAAAGEWGFVTVTGKVAKPGRVKVPSAKGIKLTAVIQDAGGFGASAKKGDIRITRTNKNGQRIQVKIDYNEIGIAGNLHADIDLMDGDVVYVPERIF